MSNLSGHIEYAIPAGRTFSTVRDRGIEYSASGHQKVKLLDQMKLALRSRHYSRRTEQTYCQWTKRFVQFHHLRHPAEMGEAKINSFLTHLAVKEKVSASTPACARTADRQNQALSALVFLYRHVMGREVGNLDDVIRAREPQRLPIVMTRDEVKAVLRCLERDKWLMASLMYGLTSG
jgi:site-specific recombinase XerD